MGSDRVLTPAFKITLAQKELPLDMQVSVDNIEIQHCVNLPGMFSFKIGSIASDGKWQGIDLSTIKIGAEVAISIGFSSLKNIIVGDITAVEPSFGKESSVTIRGFDRLYRLRFGGVSRVFENLSENDIVAEIARAVGLSVSARGSNSVINKYVRQHHQSNYNFLMKRCARINHELMMNGTQLVFRPSAEGDGSLKTLNYPTDIEQVDLSLRAPNQGRKVTMFSFDMTANKPISAVSQSAGTRERMGGKQNAYEMSSDFPASDIVLEQLSIGSIGGLQEVATGQSRALLADAIEGTALLTVGDPDLLAGKNITLSGLGPRFSGLHYIWASTHRIDQRNGYQTELKLRRTGA